MLSYFRKKPSISPKFIINRNGIVELTLSLDFSSTVANLRRHLTERLFNLSDNEQFIHSNGAPIHILDEQDTLVSELLQKNSNVIFIKNKLTRELMGALDSTMLQQNPILSDDSNLQSAGLRTSQQTLGMSGTANSLTPIVDTITFKNESEPKLLSDLLSEESLAISNDSLSSTDMKRIVEGLKQNKKVNSQMVALGCHYVIEILVEVLKVNQTLTYLLISGDMNDADCILVANALVFNNTLQTLSLRENKITAIGCEAIAEMLKSNTTLMSLDICRNTLRDEGIKLICDALIINQTLRQLDIYQTEISVKGCAMVAHMLRINGTLTSLDIGDNNIGDDGIIAIASVLKDNNALIVLGSKWNKITESGALALIDTLKTNRTLQTVRLQHNDMPNDVEKEIHKKASQIQTTGFRLCPIS